MGSARQCPQAVRARLALFNGLCQAEGCHLPRHALGWRTAPALFKLGQPLHRLGRIEEKGQHVLGHRCGGTGTAHAMFNHDGGRVAWIAGRGKADKQAVVAIFPVAALAPLAARDPPHLGGAGLAAHLDARNVQPTASGRAVAVYHFPHSAAHCFKMLLGKGHGGSRRISALHQARLYIPARSDPPGHDGELQGVHDDIALPDRSVQCVGCGPFLVIAPHLPRRIRHRPIALGKNGQVEFFAEPQGVAHPGNDVDADAIAHCIEIGVTALGDGAMHVDRTVAAQTAKETVAQPIAARTIHPLPGINTGVLQRHRHHRLESRSGWIEGVQRFVYEWMTLVIRQHAPFIVADAV